MNKKILLSTLLFLLLHTLLPAQQNFPYHPKREFRGAWIQCVDGQFMRMPPAEMRQMLSAQLDTLHSQGFNAILFQIRAEGDALYVSNIEPWSRYLSGTQGVAPIPYWDPLQFMVDQCHKRGMELHAWINPYRAKTKSTTLMSPMHAYQRYPDRFIWYGEQLFFDPGQPENRDFICLIVRDILSRYDVDGIHMDDYFYPYPIQGQEFHDEVSFARYGRGFLHKSDWRRHNVDELIKKLHETIREVKPWVKFGVSPFGIYRNKKSDPDGSDTRGLQNYDDLYADIVKWVREGWVDYNIPQLYWEIGHPAADYHRLAVWWDRHAGDRHLYIGQNVIRSVTATDLQNPSINPLPAKVALQRTLPHGNGCCMWYAAAMAQNVGNAGSLYKKTYHAYPALIPTMPYISTDTPRKVRKVKRVFTSDGPVLFWQEPKYTTEMDRAVRYVVYRFDKGEHIDLDDATHIVAVTPNTCYVLPQQAERQKAKFVITALSRLHNESRSVCKTVKW